MIATVSSPPPVKIRRGCNFRTAGSVYATSKIQTAGWNLNHFLICTPWAVDPETEIGVTNSGVSVVQRPGTSDDPIFDVYDIVGATNYPLAPFVEEAEQIEMSRKTDNMIRNKQFTLLDPRSRYFLLHRHAALPNFDTLYRNRIGIRDCPQKVEPHDHNELVSPCLGLQWEMVAPLPKDTKDREMNFEWPFNKPDEEPPLLTFQGGYMPKGWTPEVGFGIFMWLPIDILLFEIIHDPVDGKDREIKELLDTLNTNIPYSIVEE
jgi:hypothetical protein